MFVDDAGSASESDEGSEADDDDDDPRQDDLSDVEDGEGDDSSVDNDDDNDTEDGGPASRSCEPPSKKRVHFANTVETVKAPTVTVSGFTGLCIVEMYHCML